ncbi:MAG: hypothetical protein HYT22_03495 [Candidatus Niyogibacteria bacterium]|nr:hypothetical protein [Candidatus Niyogibacteria bacterium]
MKPNNTGFTLAEIVVYIAILAALSVFVVQAILAMAATLAEAKTVRRLTLDGETALERITREVRLASAVDDAASTLGAHPSRLSLDTVRSSTDPTFSDKDFYVLQGRIAFAEDGGAADYLTSPTSSTTQFIVTKITTPRSQAVRIQLALQAGSGSKLVSRSFFNTIVLRGGY